MTVAAVAPGMWRITTPLPFRPRSVQAYLARIGAGTYLLVDGGVDTPEAWAALDAGVRDAAGDWSRVAVHLVTHMHLDHLGLARRVRQAAAPRLLMSRLEAERARHAEREPGEEADYRHSLLRRNGAPAGLIAEIQAGRARAAPLAGYLEPDELLDGEAGELPAVPGWAWVWTPGHTAGHLSLFRAANRVLVAGDAVLPRTSPTIGVNRQRRDPVGDYLAALDRLDALDAALLLPGHGGPIPRPAARIEELRGATVHETERILSLLAAEPLSAWEVQLLRHPSAELPASTRMLAVRETLAHLDHLVAAGRAERVDTGADRQGFRRAGALPRP